MANPFYGVHETAPLGWNRVGSHCVDILADSSSHPSLDEINSPDAPIFVKVQPKVA